MAPEEPRPAQPQPGQPTPPADVPAPKPDAAAVATAKLYFPGETLNLLPRRLWRLTNEQVERSVGVALGTQVALSSRLLPEPHDTRYRNHAEQLALGRAESDALARAAALVYETATATLPKLYPCLADPAMAASCGPARLRELAEQLYRAPLTTEQATRINQLFSTLSADHAPVQAAAGVVEYLVQSNPFLFRREVGTGPVKNGQISLASHEVAAALSFLLWNEPPDTALRTVARDGQLNDAKTLEEQTRRLLKDERFRRAFDDYLAQWLGFDNLSGLAKDARRFPQFNAELRGQMAREISDFVKSVFDVHGGSLTALLGSPKASNATLLSGIYKQDRKEGDGFATRRGIVLLPGVLASLSGESASKPMARASLLLDRLFCQKPSLPSGISLPDVPANAAPRTTRQAFEQHENDPNCAGCHRMLDPIAFALETYDALGAYRTMESGLPIDPAGSIAFTSTPFGAVSSATELLEKASRHPDVAACAVKQMYEFAFGVAPSAGADPVLRAAYERFAASGFDLREILIAFVRSPMFTHRQGS